MRTAESRGFVRRAQYSLPPLSPIWTLPTSPRPSARLEPHGRPFAGVTVARTHPDPDGTPHVAPPTLPLLVDRHCSVGLTRHRATRWLDRVGDHAPTAWSHEHRHLSPPPFPPSVAAGQTHSLHPATRSPAPLGLRGPGGLPGPGGPRRRAARAEGRHLLHHRRQGPGQAGHQPSAR